MWKEIKLGYSRNNNVGYVKDGVLRMTREANDWSSCHPYGVAVERQSVLKSGVVLKLLKDNPHDNLMRIYDFDDNWIWCEYIDGLVLLNNDRWCPEHEKKRGCWADDNEVDLVGVYDCIKHLHKIGIAHTDITGFNIMVDKNGVYKIIDLLSCVPANDKLIKLDWFLFNKLEIDVKEYKKG